MGIIFEIADKYGKRLRLTEKQYKHIRRHFHMGDSAENIRLTIEKPTAIRCNEDDESVVYFYREFKEMNKFERYLLVSVKYLNGDGFVITSFYTNKITGLKWKI